MATVKVDSGELPSAKGKKGYELNSVLRHWQMIADGRFEYDCRALLQMIDEVDELHLWEYAEGGLHKTRDEFLEKAVLIDFDLTEASLKQIVGRLRGGEEFGLTRKEQGEKAREDKILADNRIGMGRGNKIPINSSGFTGESPTSRSYLLRALVRRAPQILEAYERNEFKSVRAAAIAAGIIKPDSPLVLLRRNWRKATLEERATFRKEIQ